jgi:hypothetical protein
LDLLFPGRDLPTRFCLIQHIGSDTKGEYSLSVVQEKTHFTDVRKVRPREEQRSAQGQLGFRFPLSTLSLKPRMEFHQSEAKVTEPAEPDFLESSLANLYPELWKGCHPLTQ